MSCSIIWEFHVATARQREFEAAYSPTGPWAQLFEHASVDFLGIELMRCHDQDGRYMTVDHWTSLAAFQAFKRNFATEYDALDRQLEGLASAEISIGAFEQLI